MREVHDQVPSLGGLLTAEEVAATAASIAGVQRPDGAIPWAATDPHVDSWNHVEAAMALLVGGQRAAAERAYEWCRSTQRQDGSWPMRLHRTTVEDAGADTNMTAYVAVGVWHHWLVRSDERFVARFWPVVRRALDWVAARQLPFGGVAWAQEYDAAGRPGAVDSGALLAGSSSVYHAFRAGVALADLVGEPQPDWELVAGRVGHAVRAHPELFLDKSTYSMDWYYPVLGGPVRGGAAAALLAERWDDFLVPGLGVRCVDTNPWVTGAETCELALALEAVDDRATAVELVRDIQHLRREDGSYWTGLVLPERVHWPVEQTTYTAAAVVLAVDALSDTTPGAAIFRDTPTSRFAAGFDEIALECGCTPAGAAL